MKRAIMLSLLVVAIVLLALPMGAAAQTTTQQPGSGPDIVISTAFPSVVSEKGRAITFPIDITNNSKEFQQVALKVDGPADWNPSFKQGTLGVNSVMVAPGKSQSVDFQVTPPDAAAAQDYSFTINGADPSGKALSQLKLGIKLLEKVAASGLKLTTQYPELRGQAGNTITFRVTVANNSEQDRSVNFSATAPKDWQITFKPAYETRQVTVISMKAGSTQDVDIDIAVPKKADSGSNLVTVRVSADKDSATLPLKLTVTGDYGVALSTASGQLNTRAQIDQESKLTLVIKNSGSAPLQNVTFNTYKPDGWDVRFDPESVASLPVDQSVQVNAIIKPAAKALTGDYMVTVNVAGGSAQDSKDIRVTVDTPTTWGWAAVAAIAVVLGGLALTFGKFSRR